MSKLNLQSLVAPFFSPPTHAIVADLRNIKIIYAVSCCGANTVVAPSFNKRFSEMAVGVETCSLLLPMKLCGSLGHGAPRPPLRQAAGRYVKYALLRCFPVLTIC